MTENDYNECVTNYADNVYRFIFKNLAHGEDANDIVQSAFEKMWIARTGIVAATAKSYLFTVAYNLMIDHLRKTKRVQLRAEFNESSGLVNQPSADHKKVLEMALSTLNEMQRSLVLLKDYEGYSYEEIGKITGLNESQVKVYLYRARIQLKAFLGKKENVL